MPELFQQRVKHSLSPLAVRLGNTRMACSLLLLASSLSTSGCFFSRKKPLKVFVPPPVYAKTPPSTETKPVDVPLPLDIGTPEPGPEPAVAVGTNLPPAPAKPVAPPKTPAAKPPPTVVEIPPPQPTPAPQPTAIYSPAERQRMNQEIDQSLVKVRAALARAEGKTLSADLQGYLNNARNNMLSAEQTRIQDLVTAVSLAKRAESFATELVTRLP